MRFCKDCVYYVPAYNTGFFEKIINFFFIGKVTNQDAKCSHISNADPVTGEPKLTCDSCRYFLSEINHCGKDAQFFEPKKIRSIMLMTTQERIKYNDALCEIEYLKEANSELKEIISDYKEIILKYKGAYLDLIEEEINAD